MDKQKIKYLAHPCSDIDDLEKESYDGGEDAYISTFFIEPSNKSTMSTESMRSAAHNLEKTMSRCAK